MSEKGNEDQKNLTGQPVLPPAVPVDEKQVLQRVDRIGRLASERGAQMKDLRMILGMVDLTSLNGTDTEDTVIALCRRAAQPYPPMSDLPSVAAVCVYPSLVPVAKKSLKGTNVKVATVAGAFPDGLSHPEIKREEIRCAVDDGADEIDMVISRGRFLQEDYRYVADEISSAKEICGKACLKVILETGELPTLGAVRRASDLAMHAGADFIKTSTGKNHPAATQQVALVMTEAIKEYWYATGRMVGLKPAGGIRSADQALQYLMLVRETLGESWLTPDYFRIGASSLVNNLLVKIVEHETGVQQEPGYFARE